jgi:predicted nucleic acid-binding protein
MGWPFCISEHIIAETHNRIRKDISPDRALEFLETTHSDIDSGLINLFVPETGDRDSAIRIISKYSDQSLSYADALTMAIMKRIGIRKVLTFDWHFTLLGFLPVPPLPP